MKSRVEKGINTQIKAEAYMLITEVIAAPSPTSSSFLSAFSDLSFLLPLYSSSLPWPSADADCKPSPILVIVGGLSVRRAFRIHLPSHYHHEHGAKACQLVSTFSHDIAKPATGTWENRVQGPGRNENGRERALEWCATCPGTKSVPFHETV
jgi:hypothetical protein